MPSATDLTSASRQRTLDCGGLKLEIKLALREGTQYVLLASASNIITVAAEPRCTYREAAHVFFVREKICPLFVTLCSVPSRIESRGLG